MKLQAQKSTVFVEKSALCKHASCWKSSCNVQVWGTSVIVACSVAVLLFCFVFVDLRDFVSKTTMPIFLQLGFRSDPGNNSSLLQSQENSDTQVLHELSRSPEITFHENPTFLESDPLAQSLQNVSVSGGTVRGSGSVTNDDQKREPDTAANTASESAIVASVEKDEAEVIRSGPVQDRNNRSKLADCNPSAGGEWVYDESYPLYRSKNCPFADPGFRCEENGRPDLDYMKYRWQPNGCDLPRFNATDILERLRGQRMVYVGDSIGRNQWESMLCMLAEGVENKTQIYEVNGETISKHTGFLSFKFEDYNLTVEYYREPFLIPQTRPPPNSPPNVTYALIVDQPCWSSSKWKDADILVFNAGHWWTDQKIRNQGCYFQVGNEINMDMDLETAFAKSLRTLVKWVDANASPKTQIFFRSFASVHFRGGAWNTGGHCHEETHPMSEEEARAEWAEPWTNKVMMNEVLGHNNTETGHDVMYIDVTTSTNYRSDAHSGLYYMDNSISKTPSTSKTVATFASLEFLIHGMSFWLHPCCLKIPTSLFEALPSMRSS